MREALAGREAALYSTCRTCEIGMTRAVGRPYRSLVHLVRGDTCLMLERFLDWLAALPTVPALRWC